MNNNEIKEILEGIEVVIKHDGTLEFDVKELKILLDYITNLQCDIDSYKTKYKNAKENLKVLQEEVKFTEDYKDAYETTMIANKMLEEKYTDYKSRIDKATEWIKNNIYTYEDDSDITIYDWDSLSNPKELLNILEGDDKDE